LAFAPNESAIAACVSLHRAEWAIQDSFQELQSDLGHDMLSDSLVRTISDHAEDIASTWAKDVHENPTTLSYRPVDRRILEEKATAALHQFSRWLAGLEADEEIRAFYKAVGGQRRGQGIELCDLISSLMLLRKHIWQFNRSKGMGNDLMEVYRVMELDRRIIQFYDKAMYQLVRGYLDAEPEL
jgi:hypothetical protein